ncbi:MAG: hypothetical protein FJX72_16365 [Armatimonadetes bacterium]|nr:hypothetical protein [Armatimonadota bacterium]
MHVFVRCVSRFRYVVGCLVALSLSGHAQATDPDTYASVNLLEPSVSVYYAPQGGSADVDFETDEHWVAIDGSPSATYCVVWTMTLRCTTSLGAHVAYVDTDWSGQCPATPNSSGWWEHQAEYVGAQSGSLSLSPGSYSARAESYFTASFVGGDPEEQFGASRFVSYAFGVVTEAPPGGGGGS